MTFSKVNMVVDECITKTHNKIFHFLYSVILTEYVAIEPRVCVCVYMCMYACVYVCMYARVCVISTAQTDEPILMKLSTNDLTDICQCHFSRFLKFRI